VGHVLLSKSAHGGWCSTVLEIKLTVVRQVRPPEEGAVRRPSFLVVLGGVLSYMVSAPPPAPYCIEDWGGAGTTFEYMENNNEWPVQNIVNAIKIYTFAISMLLFLYIYVGYIAVFFFKLVQEDQTTMENT